MSYDPYDPLGIIEAMDSLGGTPGGPSLKSEAAFVKRQTEMQIDEVKREILRYLRKKKEECIKGDSAHDEWVNHCTLADAIKIPNTHPYFWNALEQLVKEKKIAKWMCHNDSNPYEADYMLEEGSNA